MQGFAIAGLTTALPVIAGELGVVAIVAIVCYLLARWAIARLAVLQRHASAETIAALRARIRNGVLAVAALAAAVVLAYNGWLVARGVDVAGHTAGLLGAI